MSEDRIREIKERLRATTPGVWRVVIPDGDYFGADDPTVETDAGQYIAQTTYDGLSFSARDTAGADAEFIAHAKEDVAWLLEQLEIFLRK